MMPLDPSELPEVIRFLTEQNHQMADRLAPLREGKCPKCLTPLVAGGCDDGFGSGRFCPSCGWGRDDSPAAASPDDRCGLCGGPAADA